MSRRNVLNRMLFQFLYLMRGSAFGLERKYFGRRCAFFTSTPSQWVPLISSGLALLIFTSCSTRDDARLNGTWVSNREASLAASMERNPRLTNASPARIIELGSLFGHQSVTYSNGVGISHLYGVDETYHYRVIEKGRDYVVLRASETPGESHEIRLRFEKEAKSYWVRTQYGPSERFDKVESPKE